MSTVQKLEAARQRKISVLVTMTLAFLIANGAHAALPVALTDMFTDMAADGALIFAAALALWAALRGSIALMKLGSKFLSKAGA